MTYLEQPTLEDVRFIVENLREDDRREVYCTQLNDEADDLAAQVFARCGFAWVAKKDGEPIAVLGGLIMWRGVWSVFLLSTNRFDEVKFLVTRLIKRIIIPTLLIDMNAHLVFTYSASWREKPKHWLEYFGGKKEHTIKSFGRDGEDMDLFCLRKESI